MRYKLSEIAAVCGGKFSGVDRTVTRVVTDSRSERRQRDKDEAYNIEDEVVSREDEPVFVAIRTANRDGHAYIAELYARGVRAFLVLKDFDTTPYPGAGFVVVPDTVAALQALAAHWRNGFTGKVVGITGSYGKTIVKEWIAQLAPQKHSPAGNHSAGGSPTMFRSPKSWNSQIGVPLSVLMAAGTEDYIVIEAGISEPGEMARLERIIRPDIGILTTLGAAHIENFASPEQLRDEKMLLFRNCPDVIVESDLCRDEVAADDFSRRNAALALAFWRHEGYDVPDAAVRNLEPVAMRLEVREGLYNSVIINDTYNSDLNSLSIALDYLGRVAGKGPRMVVMPGRNADGGFGLRNINSNDAERAVRLVKEFGVERLVEIGPGLSADDFLRSLTSADLQGRTILVKGGARLGFDSIARALDRRSHTTVMEVDLDAMIHNLRLCRSHLAPGVGVIPMIKAAGYGHGTFEVARTLESQGVDYLAVAFADEGVALRESGIAMPIVVLNADEGSFEGMIRHRLEPEIYNFTSLEEFTALVKRHGEQHYPIHIKLDTGMHRLGFREAEIPRLAEVLAGAGRYVQVATVFSHLAAADDAAEDDFTRGQIALFDGMSSRLAAALPYTVRRHLANTKGVERFPGAQFDMVRLGIGLYGFGMEGARPVAALKTRIVHTAELAAGETVGYNRRGVLTRPSRIATVPIGYADGLDRRLSNGAWKVLAGGRQAPIVGNVCMDSCMVDITGIDGVEIGSEVVIFSAAPGNTAEDMARVLGTIPYEVLTSISARVKRIYIKE